MMERSHEGRAGLWKWACIASALLLALAIALTLEPSLWRSFLFAVLLACPALAIWGAFKGIRPLPVPLGPVPVTRGLTLNWIAPWYDLVWGQLFGLGRRFRNRVFGLAAPQKGEHVLDVGCSTGWFTRLAAAAVGPTGVACGIDPAPDMIRIAMQTGAPHGAQFQLGVIEDLSYGDARFDLVVASMVIHHLPPDLKQIGLREILRVLKPGGRLLVVELDRPGHWFWRFITGPLRFHPNLRDHLEGRTAKLLSGAGFVRVEPREQWARLITFWSARRP